MSEAGSGSDVMSMKLSATKDGEHLCSIDYSSSTMVPFMFTCYSVVRHFVNPYKYCILYACISILALMLLLHSWDVILTTAIY